MDNIMTATTSNEVHHCDRCRRPYRGDGVPSAYSAEHTVCGLCARDEKYEISGVFPPCEDSYWEAPSRN